MGHTRFWTEDEREKLRKLRTEGLDYDVIAARLGRGKEGVSRELRRLGLSSRHSIRQTPKVKLGQ
jgi:IS30 family transposase